MRTSDRHRPSGIKTGLRADGHPACGHTLEIPCCCNARLIDQSDQPFSRHDGRDMDRAPFADRGKNFSCMQRPHRRYPELIVETSDLYHAGTPVTLFRDEHRVSDLRVEQPVRIATAMTRIQKTPPIKSYTVGAVRRQCSNGIRIATDGQRANGHSRGNVMARGAPRKPMAAFATAMKSARQAREKNNGHSMRRSDTTPPSHDRCVVASIQIRNLTHAMSPVTGRTQRSSQTRSAALQASFDTTTRFLICIGTA